MYHNNKFTPENKAKCELFNSYFAGQCTPFVNNSHLPRLKSIGSSVERVSNSIKKSDPNKAHPHYKISIRYVKYKLVNCFPRFVEFQFKLSF